MDDSEEPNQNGTNGYSKRPMWQWVVIYLIAAVIVYGIIYYLFIRDSGSSGY